MPLAGPSCCNAQQGTAFQTAVKPGALDTGLYRTTRSWAYVPHVAPELRWDAKRLLQDIGQDRQSRCQERQRDDRRNAATTINVLANDIELVEALRTEMPMRARSHLPAILSVALTLCILHSSRLAAQELGDKERSEANFRSLDFMLKPTAAA